MRKDKSVVWEESSVNCLRKANGEIDFIIAVSENITEKKQANFDSGQFFYVVARATLNCRFRWVF